MDYAPARFHRSERKLADAGEAFAYTPENQAKFDENVTRYPADQRKSAILYALYLVQQQQGYITGAAMRFVADADRLHGRGSRGRRVVLHDVLHEAGREVRAERVPHAVVRAAGRRARHRGTVREARDSAGPDDGRRRVHADRSRVPGRVRPRAGRDGERRLARAARAGAGGAVRRRDHDAGQGSLHWLPPARGEEDRHGTMRVSQTASLRPSTSHVREPERATRSTSI